MAHKQKLLALIFLLVIALMGGFGSFSTSITEAQGTAQAVTQYALTVYSQPDRTSAIVGVFIPQAKVVIEALDNSTDWMLGHSTDGMIRGWVERRYLAIGPEVNASDLLYSNEIMYVPTTSNLDIIYASINLNDYPTVPTHMGQARAIFEESQLNGLNKQVVSKVGDCISDNEHFLSPFGLGSYSLGTYTSLQPTVYYFSESLAYSSLAAYDGLVTNAVLDPLFANPLACLPGETPLRCEYRVHRSSVAIIMFGAQDLLFTSPEEFDRNLRRIVHETIQAGVVPILSTFPGNLERWDQATKYNQIVVSVALDYDIPLMNLWRALYDLPNHGLNADGRHLSLPLTTSGDLTSNNLLRGYPMRNLITLQTLKAVWQNAMY